MKSFKMDRNTFKNASFLLAGSACLLMIAGELFSPNGVFPIRGIPLLNGLIVPLLCLWVGMMIRLIIGKPRWWLLFLVSVAMGASYIVCFFVQSTPYWLNDRFQWYGILLLGILLPWERLWENRDKCGIKSFALFLLSSLVFCALDLFQGRMEAIELPAPYEDLGALLGSVSKYVVPFALLLPVFFAAEFSFSNAGQWLGRQKWFRLLGGILAFISFFVALFNIVGTRDGLFMRCLMILLVQPIIVYLIVIICRIIRKLCKKQLTWKEVFAI